jgi:YaiO family outer membrane protein
VEILPYQVELGGNYAKLSNGARDGSVYLAAEMKLDTRNNIYASFRRENRYAFMDNEAMGGFYQPIDEQFSFVAEMSVSPTHYVVPSRSILAQLEFMGLKGWGANMGLRHAQYDNALMNVLSMNVERSWGNYRLAYSHFQGFWANHGSTSSGQLQAARYYGDYNWFGLNFSDGSELDTLPDLQVTSTNVRTMIVNGRHWINRSVALTYAIGQSRHGNFYKRNGIQLGLRYQF